MQISKVFFSPEEVLLVDTIVEMKVGLIWHKLPQEVQILKFYSIMVILALLYGCKTWIIRNKDRGKIETVDMKFLKGVIGCRHLDHVRSVAVREGSAIKRSLNTIVSRLPVQQVIIALIWVLQYTQNISSMCIQHNVRWHCPTWAKYIQIMQKTMKAFTLRIREELKVKPILNKIVDYWRRWYEHIMRMQDSRLPKLAFN